MSSIYTRIASGLLFPLHEKLKGHDSVARLKALEESQWWPLERLKEAQVARLRAFLQEIGARVPYYRELFAAQGFDPATIKSVDELSRLPFLTKPVIRAQGDALKAVDHGPLARYNTGGSSGEPLIFYMGKSRKSHDVAAKWRATRWCPRCSSCCRPRSAWRASPRWPPCSRSCRARCNSARRPATP